MQLSVVIPAYNESLNIRETIKELTHILNNVNLIKKYEIIVVDDHSSDNTFGIVSKVNDRRIMCLRLSRRCGSHIALRAGMAYATGSAVLCISADGQDDPSCIGDMVSKWRKGTKVIWALRKSRGHEPWYIRKPAQAFYRLMFWLSGAEYKKIDLSRAAFFLLDKSVVNAMNSCPEKNTSVFGLIVWLGFSQDFVEYEQRLRRFGKSKWTLRSRLRLAKDWVVAFSGIPLKLMSLFGIFFAILGFIYGIYLVIKAISGNPPVGWSSIMVAILVLGGIQMIMLGIVGEYLWRNLDESRKRPLYFIERKTENSSKG